MGFVTHGNEKKRKKKINEKTPWIGFTSVEEKEHVGCVPKMVKLDYVWARNQYEETENTKEKFWLPGHLFCEGWPKMSIFINTQGFSRTLNIKEKAIKRPTIQTEFNLDKIKKHHIYYILPRHSSK